MSLNEIYWNTDYESVKNWQNYRVNNLTTGVRFDIDTTGASVGDILQLNGSLENTWIPYSATVAAPLEFAVATVSTLTVPNNSTGVPIQFGSVSGSPSFTLTGSGLVQVNENASLLLFLNMTTVPVITSLPLIALVKYSTTGNVTLCEMSPYCNGIEDPYTSVNCIVPAQVISGDTIGVVGYTVGNSSTQFSVVNGESSLNILRLN